MAGLSVSPAAAVLRAESIDRARKFYTEVLGLSEMPMPSGRDHEAMFAAGDGTMVDVYERPGMPAPANTALGFGIAADSFDSVVADLKAKGVKLEDYDIPEMGLKTVNGIAAEDGSKAAWFKDSEGNIINIATM